MATSSADGLAGVRWMFGPEMLRHAALLAAAGLLGFSVILWIAANWVEWGRFTRFFTVGGILFAAGLCAALLPRLRIPGALIAFLTVGALLAAIGQTYQSVADPWPLFAAWAVLGLPLALAARADALWALWVAVIYTALTLWLMSAEQFLPTGGALHAWNAWTVWLIAGALAASLHPAARLQSVTGPSRWSARFALVALVALIAATTVFAPLSLLKFSGLLAIVGLVALLAVLRPLDLPVLGIVVLALDVLLISTVVFLLARSSFTLGGLFVVGAISAGIFAASAYGLLELAKSEGRVMGRAATVWPVVALSGVGAIIAALPIFLFIVFFIGDAFINTPITAYVAGTAFLGVAGSVVLRAKSIGFVQFLALIFCAAGVGMLLFALYRDLPFLMANVVVASGATALAVFSGTRWLATLLGALAAVFAGLVFTQLIGTSEPRGFIGFSLRNQFAWGLLTVAALGALVLCGSGRDLGEPTTARPGKQFAGFSDGWSALVLVGALFAVGPTFLIMGAGSIPAAMTQSVALGLELTPQRVLAIMIAGLSLAALMSRAGRLTPISVVAAAVALALAYLVPAFAAPVAIWAAAVATGRRVLAIAAVGAAIWIVGAFYYWLGLPLLTKSVILAALGLALALTVALVAPASALARSQQPLGRAGLVPLALVAVSLVLTGGLAAQTIATNEDIMTNGRTIYVALQPVDPRSRIQGDYMTLRFEAPRFDGRRRHQSLLWALARVDDRNIATIDRFAETPGQAAGAANSDDVSFKITWQRRQPIIGTNAFHFEEGTARVYEAARFGEFRLSPAGDIILVGLADEALKPLGRPML